MRECYPEEAPAGDGEAAGDGDLRRELSAAGMGSRFESRAGLEEVETLQRTARAAVVVVRERQRHEQHFVLKVFPDAADSAFLGELRHLQSLRHPLVVPLLGAFLEGGRAHLVMPFYSRGSIRPWVEGIKARHQALCNSLAAGSRQAAAGQAPAVPAAAAAPGLSGQEWAAVRRVLRQLLQAVAFCHGRGVAHRDVKAKALSNPCP